MACKSKKIRRAKQMQGGGGVDPMSLAMQGQSMANQFGGGIVDLFGIGEANDEGYVNPGEAFAAAGLKNIGMGPLSLISAFSAKRKAKQYNEQLDKQKAIRREALDPTRASYNPYTPTMPYGGMAGDMVELERGETYRLPDGSINKISNSAPTHSTGGVPIWLPSGTEVLGKLDAGTQKTFKQLGDRLKQMQDKYENTMSSNPTSIASNTSSLMLKKIQDEYTNLFEEQQSLNGNVVSNESDMIQGKKGIYIKPSKRGTFTAASKKRGKSVQGFASQVLANKGNYSSAMVKKANFARNASKWKKGQGGMKVLPGYIAPEGITDVRDFQSMHGLTVDNIWGRDTQKAWDQYGSTYTSNQLTPVSPMSGVVPNPSLDSTRSTMTTPWGSNASPFMSSGPPQSDQKPFDWGNALSTAGALAPVAYNLGQALRPAEQLNYTDYLNPYISDIRSTMRDRRFNIKPTLESNKLAQATYNYNIRRAAPSKGSYLSNIAAGSASKMRADAGAYAQKQNVDNEYLAQQAQMDAMLGQGIADRRFQVKDINLRNEAARRAMMATGLGQLSQYAQMNQLMRNQQLTDQQRLALLPSMVYNYMYDPTNLQNAYSFVKPR